MTYIFEWILILGTLNLFLFFIGLFIFLQKHNQTIPFSLIFSNIKSNLRWIFLIVCVVIIHLIEVNLIDAFITSMIGVDYASFFQIIEGSMVSSFTKIWHPFLILFFVFVYIGVYPFTLWFTPLYFILENQKQAMKTLAFGLLIIYCIALPFYLFIPVTNVYTFFAIDSALNGAIPNVESFFYSTTTQNNCFPSLHVAVTLLITLAVSKTHNKKLSLFCLSISILVIISVLYLVIHWISDVIGGLLIFVIAWFITQRYIKEDQP